VPNNSTTFKESKFKTLWLSGLTSEVLRDSQESYKKLFDEYETTLPDREEALNQVLALQKKYQRIALTCFEKSLFKNTLNTKINHSAILFADKKRQ
jgi:uncharacterized protein (DUF488 family)